MALNMVAGDVTIGIQGEDFSYLFSTTIGGMESLYKHGKEWLYRAPRPTFWRATTDNDRGNGFSYQSAAWLAADLFLRCRHMEASLDGEPIEIPLAPANNRYGAAIPGKEFVMTFVYESAAVPGMETRVTYCVTENGKIGVRVRYCGSEGPVSYTHLTLPTT